MNPSRLSPDDPKLTAYALGELPESDRAAVEAALREDPAARAAVEQIRQFAQRLETALAHEPEPQVRVPVVVSPGGEPQVITLNGHAAPATAPHRPTPPYASGGFGAKILRFPQLYYVVGGVAAACFAVMLALRDERPAQEVRYYTEIKLNPPGNGTVAVAEPQALPTADAAPAVDNPKTEADELRLQAFEVRKQQFAEAARANTRELAARGLLEQVRTAQAAKTGERSMTYAAVESTTGLRPASGQYVGAAVPGAKGTDATWASGHTPGSLALSKQPATPTGGQVMLTATDVHLGVPYGSDVAATRSKTARVAAAQAPRPYYYPDDPGFVIPAEPRSRVPAPQMHAYVTPWPQEPAAPLLAPSLKSPPERFSFRVPGEWNNTIDALRRMPPPAGVPWPRPFVPRVPPVPEVDYAYQPTPHNTESYAFQHDNRFVAAASEPFSTFAVDVDTASYANVRRFVEGGRLPPPDAVRIEELLNYFSYQYTAPAADNGTPFLTSLEVADAPWAPGHRLVRIGIKAREVSVAQRPAANLVFLLDVSGSMQSANKLPLVKQAMRVLIQALRPDDRVAIVTYAGTSGLALPSTLASRSQTILEAIDALHAGGSTNGAMGIQLAYDIAKANVIAGGINRVILCTDGDFNVGVTNQGELARLIEEKAKTGVALTALGFGMHNYKDSTLELLADKGNGNYGYIDSRREAEKLLAQQVNGTLLTVAKDVKIQVDFNPARVASYRLLGYEDRLLNKDDFNNDAVDAGEIGAGHTVTALYEIVPVGADAANVVMPPPVDVSRYAVAAPLASAVVPHAAELLAVKIRYKAPDGDVSQKLEIPLTDGGAAFANASSDFRFAAAVAAYGMVLRESPYRGSASIGDVIAWAAGAAAKPADDPAGQRAEFIDLARRTQRLMGKG
ncbi:von Willebrand factor type A domain-containing protein [Opitutus sp. ER46]|uniref:YfbK domain-containing protein n=1 Tax=Opitutus sp. ER46 TaxID=2161864 RepID=UPI000D2F77C8|nr:von Willebrand factor type A domain-containing protein [Opitutus sp. ER46]PTX95671.1 hypothetical protein DB354_09665 [Opitutus sp. ER46]